MHILIKIDIHTGDINLQLGAFISQEVKPITFYSRKSAGLKMAIQSQKRNY